MIGTNRDRLLEIAVIGEVVHSVVEPSYMTNWDSTPTVGLGRGGIVYNVKPGDPCFGWAWGEKVEPGVSADGTGSDGEKNSFRSFSCIGNEARVVDGEAKGGSGVVVGKVGYLPEGGHHLVLHFEEKTLEKLAIGDKVQVKTCGVGLEFNDHPGVRAVGLSPRLLEKMGLGERERRQADRAGGQGDTPGVRWSGQRRCPGRVQQLGRHDPEPGRRRGPEGP